MPSDNIFHFAQDITSRLFFEFYHARWLPGRKDINRLRAWALQDRHRFFDLPTDTQSYEVLSMLQMQVKYCRAHVPYYQKLLNGQPEHFPRDFEEYRQIPKLTKSIIRSVGDALLSDEFPKSQLRRHSTGGSSGEPISVFLTVTEDALGDAGNEYFMSQIGGGASKRIATLYGGELDLNAHPSKVRYIKDRLLNIINHGCFRLDEETLMQVHSDFEKFRPNVIIGYASAIYLLAKLLQKRQIKPSYPRMAIVTAAEKLDALQRDIIEKTFHVPVVERYGSRDAGLIGYQRVGDQRIWIDTWDYLLEPETFLDKNNMGSILVSRLHTRAMPLLRYQMGDLGTFSKNWQPHQPACWLEEVKGRELDWIYLPNGRSVHGSEFPHLFKDFDILFYQVIQDKDGKVTVVIVPSVGFVEEKKNECEYVIRENLRGIPLEFCYKEEIPRGKQNKLRPVISHFNSVKAL